MEELKRYIKVLHKPIITITRIDIELDTYYIKDNHLFEVCLEGSDNGGKEVKDLGKIVAMSDNKEDLIKLQKYTRIEKSKLNEMNAYISAHKKDLEVLNIITEKLVDMSWLMYALYSTSSIEKALNVYNDKFAGNIPLTLEEISKLNRWLEK